jgi:hypothetical protein
MARVVLSFRSCFVTGSLLESRTGSILMSAEDHPLAQTIVSLLEKAGTRVFVLRALTDQEATPSWPVPSLASVRGTTLGAVEEPSSSMPRMAVRDGKLVPIPRDQWVTVRLEEQVDALLDLGPSSSKTIAPIPPTICADRAYIEQRLQRIALAGLPPAESERLKQFCTAQTRK